MNGPSFLFSSSSDNMVNLNNYIDCSDEGFPISDLSFVLHNMYSCSKRATPQSAALEVKNSMLDSLLTEKQKNINTHKSPPILTLTHSEI